MFSRKFAATSVAGALLLSLSAVAPAAAAPPPGYTCTGDLASPGFIPAGTYTRLTMPAGSFCVITDGRITVKHRTWLGRGALLFVVGGKLTLHGGLTVGRDAGFGAGVYGPIGPLKIDGSVDVKKGGVFFVGLEDPYGPISTTIRGSLTAHDASAVVIHNTDVRGSVTVRGGGGANAVVEAMFGPGLNYSDFEDSRIHGSFSETGFRGIWGGVIRSKIWGRFTFSHNVQPVDGAGEYDIGWNVIFGSATCSQNKPAPNLGDSPGGSSIVHGRIRGNQAATCFGL